MHPIIDTHCHLDFAEFDHDREQVLKACANQGITDVVVPAVSQDTWQNTIKLCAQRRNNISDERQTQQASTLHLALGLHPIFIDQHQPQHLLALDRLVAEHSPIAVGEIGLDYYLKHLDQEKQRVFFDKQLIIANQHNLPVIIHVRKAHDDCVKQLQRAQVCGGIIHNFNGSIQHAHKYIEMGFALGFGGMLTFERSRVIRQLAKQIPLTSIVLETDAPDLTVEAHRGERNSPAYLPHVLTALAEIKQLPCKEVAGVTSQNAKRTLGLL